MAFAAFCILLGLVLLTWSADRFISAAASIAHNLGMPALLVGMVIVGFGTSAPEMAVSSLAAAQHNSGIALGNAYGSNIANIALILGLTALITPIAVHSRILSKELPILIVVTGLAVWQLCDLELSRLDAAILLAVFLGLMLWTIYNALRQRTDVLATEVEHELVEHAMPTSRAATWLVIGLVVLILSSRLLVWGAVYIARQLGISDLIIGLTIVSVGTSLPELAACIAAARKGQHDLALGNIIGSNLFNTLAVVGVAGLIHPATVSHEIISRDFTMLGILSIFLFAACYGFRGPGRVNRLEAGFLVVAYVIYLAILAKTAVVAAPSIP